MDLIITVLLSLGSSIIGAIVTLISRSFGLLQGLSTKINETVDHKLQILFQQYEILVQNQSTRISQLEVQLSELSNRFFELKQSYSKVLLENMALKKSCCELKSELESLGVKVKDIEVKINGHNNGNGKSETCNSC
jgi:DNA repair exonuclease SbcCD ATPase subunit